MSRTFLALLAAFLLFIAPASASAECAWVLWQQWGQAWMLEGATDSREECERAQRQRTQELVSAGAQIARSGPGGQREARLFYCSPDTVDPRGPKGK